jgi:dolichyl-phosphate-mannose--protein O-mannosyl transferase
MGNLHRIAAKQITQGGLSVTARIIPASFSAVFAAIMFLTAPPTDKAIYFYAFGALCVLICIACLTTGRVRQFCGSILGTALFVLSAWFLYSQVQSGHHLSRGPGDPSLLSSILFLLAFGIPGMRYAVKARFGFGKTMVPL